MQVSINGDVDSVVFTAEKERPLQLCIPMFHSVVGRAVVLNPNSYSGANFGRVVQIGVRGID